MEKYDYLIIGSGPAAYKFIVSLHNPNKRILVIEKGKFGGICPNYGCEPKIFLEGAVRAVLSSQQLVGLGIALPAVLDWPQLIQRKKAVFKSYPADAINLYNELGADVVQGTAKLVGAHKVVVDDQMYQADKIIIATGQRPRKLPIDGSENTINSDDVFDMEKLPKRITFIGGGFVSMELATLLNAAGSTVDIIEFTDRPLKAFDTKPVKTLVDEMTSRGVNFYFNQTVNQVKKTTLGYQLITKQGLIIDTDQVVDASGRMPNLEELDLDVAGIKYDQFGIIVDEHLETSSPDIFALGDVVKKQVPKLTSTAQFEGEYLSSYLTGQTNQGLHYPVIATAVFAFPQIAQAGISLAEAQRDQNYRIVNYKLAQQEHMYAGMNDMSADLSLIFDSQNKLVGATEVSQTAADDIDNLVDIIGLELDKDDWRRKFIPVFPALSYKTRDLIE